MISVFLRETDSKHYVAIYEVFTPFESMISGASFSVGLKVVQLKWL